MKLKICFLGLLCTFFTTIAQENTGTVELKIGNKVPDVLLGRIMNNNAMAPRFTDFRGKLLILDFWATWCAPCVAMIPKMEALQQGNSDKLQILPVAYQPEKEVQAFYDKLSRRLGKRPALPQVIGDTVLGRLFPHQMLPHYVWIDKNGIVQAITDEQAVTSANIDRFLASGELGVKEKRDEQIAYDPSRPLFFAGQENGDTLVRSRLSGYQAGAGRGLYKNVDVEGNQGTRRIIARNVTLPELFRLAYGKEVKETVLEVKEASRLEDRTKTRDDLFNWLKQGHGYCYELMVPQGQRKRSYALMQDELKSYFPAYRAALEKRKVNCLALVRTSSIDKLHTKGGEPSATIDAFGCSFRSCYLYVFISRLQTALQFNPLPLVDETDYKDMADLELTANMSSVEELNEALAPYDLKFIEKPAEVEMLVIRDR